VVVVAGEQHQLPVGAERPADVGEEGRRDLGHLALRRVAQLDAVAEHHQAIGAPHRLEQRRAQLRPAQQIGAGRAAEVQVGDHERPHGGGG
jgi:hypothetical protein